MSALHLNDQVRFRTMTPEGLLIGSGIIAKIFPAGQSHWLHVRQDDGNTRMLFEATTQIEVIELEAA